MNTARPHRTDAFTIIELLVVISIIAIIAALVVGLAGVAGSSKKGKRAEAELAKLVTLIDSYKAKVGVYPPDNPGNPGVNSLLYELAGAIRDRQNVANPTNITPFGRISSSELLSTYGINGMYNATEMEGNPEDVQVKRILKEVKPDQVATVAGHRSLVIPVDGPNGQPNPWHYLRGANAVHNPESYDLWVEIVLSRGANGKTNIVGNWKN